MLYHVVTPIDFSLSGFVAKYFKVFSFIMLINDHI